MVGYGFTILSETPCADPHAGCCGGWGLETLGYPIMFILASAFVRYVDINGFAIFTWKIFEDSIKHFIHDPINCLTSTNTFSSYFINAFAIRFVRNNINCYRS